MMIETTKERKMNFSENGRTLLKILENPKRIGYSREAGEWFDYEDDLDVSNIGWGHKIKKSEIERYQLSDDGITNQEVENLLTSDIAPIEEMLNEKLYSLVQEPNRKSYQNEFDALVIFVYNIGMTAFLNSHVYGFLEEEQDENACKYWAQWCHDRDPITHQEIICEGLVKRRQAEIELFNS